MIRLQVELARTFIFHLHVKFQEKLEENLRKNRKIVK